MTQMSPATYTPSTQDPVDRYITKQLSRYRSRELKQVKPTLDAMKSPLERMADTHADKKLAEIMGVNRLKEFKELYNMPSTRALDSVTQGMPTTKQAELKKTYNLADGYGKIPGTQDYQKLALDPSKMMGYKKCDGCQKN